MFPVAGRLEPRQRGRALLRTYVAAGLFFLSYLNLLFFQDWFALDYFKQPETFSQAACLMNRGVRAARHLSCRLQWPIYEARVSMVPNQPTTASSLTAWQKRRWLFSKRLLPIALVYSGAAIAPFCFSWSGLVVGLVLLLLTGVGITVGFHRLLTHRSFSTYRWMKRLLATLGTLAFQDGVVNWVAVHRLHHANSDTTGDPHSPKNRFWHGYCLWLFSCDDRVADERLKMRYVKDLCSDPFMMFLENWTLAFQAFLFVTLYAIGECFSPDLGFSWAIYGTCVRIATLQQSSWLVNSVTHTWGYRNHQTRDQSTNSWLVAFMSLGEGWHNNHHAYPRSARFGFGWYEFDAGFLAIRLLQSLRLAWNVVFPKDEPTVRPHHARAPRRTESE